NYRHSRGRRPGCPSSCHWRPVAVSVTVRSPLSMWRKMERQPPSAPPCEPCWAGDLSARSRVRRGEPQPHGEGDMKFDAMVARGIWDWQLLRFAEEPGHDHGWVSR